MPYSKQLAVIDKTPRKSSKKKDVETRVVAMIQDSLRYHETEHARFRIKAGKYYRGEPFGDEDPERSKIVLTPVRDAVLQQLPSLMRVFFGPDGAVEFVARRPDAVDLAEQQTDMVHHVFSEENPGFFVMYSVFKDALVRRIGVVKWWWEEKEIVESERLSGISDEDLTALLQKEPDLEIEKDSTETGDDGTLTCVVRRKVKRGQAKVAAVPPEEFIYNRSARSIEDAVLVAHVTSITAGEALAMGYKQKDIDAVGESALLVPSEERNSRRPTGASSYETDATNTDENRKISHVEAYVRMDFGEGIEHKKMCFLGAKLKLVNTEPAPDRPFAVFTPDPEPHEIQGLSLSDMAMDLQLIDSHVARGILNSLNLSLNPRTVFNSEMVSVKDLMNVEIGALIRTSGDAQASVRELTHTFVGAEGLGVLEFFKGVREERLGTSRASVGLNPDALQSSSSQAVDATVSKAEARTELMARVFAENMKTLFRGLYNLLRRNQDKARMVRLRGKYVNVDPSMWPPDPDVSVRVGIGGGTKQEKLAFIQSTLEKQEAVMQHLGPNNILTDLKRYRGMLSEGTKVMGYDPGRAWKDVTDQQIQEMESQAQQPPPKDPAQMLAEAQVQNETMALQNKQAELAADQEMRAAEIQLKREELKAKDDLERDKLEIDLFLRAKELEFKYNTAVDTANIKAEVERNREEMKAGTAVTQSLMDASMVPEEQEVAPPPAPEEMPAEVPEMGMNVPEMGMDLPPGVE